MEVLREHRDSVMAVLEAFVYDPLLNWRLMDSKRSSVDRSTFRLVLQSFSKGTQMSDKLQVADWNNHGRISENNYELDVNKFSPEK